jgi:hypothetical protein
VTKTILYTVHLEEPSPGFAWAETHFPEGQIVGVRRTDHPLNTGWMLHLDVLTDDKAVRLRREFLVLDDHTTWADSTPEQAIELVLVAPLSNVNPRYLFEIHR